MSECIFAAKAANGTQSCSLKLCDKDDLEQCCESCTEYTGPDRGLGDKVKRVTDQLGLKPCGGCQRRREAMNRWSEKRRMKRKDGTR